MEEQHVHFETIIILLLDKLLLYY